MMRGLLASLQPARAATLWPALRVSIATALGAMLLVGNPVVRAQQADTRYFAQTGYRVDMDPFWSFFQTHGGVRAFGYPVSRVFKLDGFPIQIFQRIVLQLEPDGSVATLNLLDAGLLPYTHINGSTFPAADPTVISQTPSVSDPNYADKIVSFVQSNTPDVFAGNQVNFLQTFNTTVAYADAFPGGDAPQSLLPLLNLQIWGAPTSKPSFDPKNSNFIYQRFQRGIMHFDKTCGCTQGLLLADYLKALLTGQNLPPDLEAEARSSKYYRQYAPGQPLGIARPAELPNSDLTSAFVQDGSANTATATTPDPEFYPIGPGASFAYGFQVQLWNLSPDDKRRVLGLIQQAGFNMVKQQVEWSAVETAPGQFDWSDLDAIVSAAIADNLRILLSVQHAPTFYQSPGSGMFPADPSKYRTFLQTLSARYRGKIQAYEIWNEENLSRETGVGNVDPSHYLPILAAGSAGVRAGDPNATILLGAPSPTGANIHGQSLDDLQYLNQLYALNGGDIKRYYDAVSAHPSGFSNPPDCTPRTPQCSLSGAWNNHPSFFAFTRIGQYRDTMMRNGESDKKIWFTEFGYCSGATPPAGYEYCRYLTPQNQADFLVQAVARARTLDYVGAMVVWNLNFQQIVPATDEKWGFGVLNPDGTPRPAYSALATMPKT